MEWFDVTREQVVAVLEFPARSLDAPPSMRILFDHGTPAPLIPFLEGHAVTRAKQAGRDRLVNGELLSAAETAGFELLVTPDNNMRYQQNLKRRSIAIIVLGNAQWPVPEASRRRPQIPSALVACQ
jgi:hypothetical protein